jgi:hypothetical protein
MTSPTASDALRALSKLASPLLGLIPGAGPIVGPMAEQALELAADLAESGADVVAELKEIRRSHARLQDVRGAWGEAPLGVAVEASSTIVESDPGT